MPVLGATSQTHCEATGKAQVAPEEGGARGAQHWTAGPWALGAAAGGQHGQTCFQGVPVHVAVRARLFT